MQDTLTGDQTGKGAESPAAPAEAKTESKDDARPEVRDEPPIVTRHTLTVNGQTLEYTATAGKMPLKNDKGEIDAQMFFIAYTVDRPEGSEPRPLTFAFNGGPGSASIWLHAGALGPKRVHLNDDGTMPPPPFRMVDNESTWLAETDIVFIDPIGTGFSRPVKDEDGKRYWTFTGDIESVSEFIRLYLTRNSRWTSPLFLAGESYGTLRSAGLAKHLIDRGIALNGIVLISSVLSFQTLDSGNYRGNDLPHVLYVPSFTATAWYHGKLTSDLQNQELPEVLRAAERWAMSDYLVALAKGDTLEPDERQAITSQLARFTGLSEQYVDDTELRVYIMRFCKELLRRERETVGRLDSRFTGVDALNVTEEPDFDPSMVSPTPPFTAAFNDYVRNTLGYETDDEYETLSMAVNREWKFDGDRMGAPETSEALREAFARNPHMRVLIAQGYYDLATPYFAIEYTVNHMGLDRAARERVEYTYYDSGHMMYLERESRARFTADVTAFIRAALDDNSVADADIGLS
jgi:carboxypeptidase C (cathepsin A)